MAFKVIIISLRALMRGPGVPKGKVRSIQPYRIDRLPISDNMIYQNALSVPKVHFVSITTCTGDEVFAKERDCFDQVVVATKRSLNRKVIVGVIEFQSV